jgi:L-ascorbate metabolism protein UlaG (beta-lactamase superfamily)
MIACHMTYVGASTLLIEVDGLRLLTDPVLDPPGEHYSFGWGTGSRKLAGPALDADAIGDLDAVLLSHDQHADNLDRAGRELLPRATRVLTTQRGAVRLGGNARGLAPWTRFDLEARDGTRMRVVATPARHGPPLSRPIVGDVIGFLLQWEGQRHGSLYLSGDTVWFDGVAEVGRRFDVGTFVPYLGAVRFPISGPARYTFTAAQAVRATRALGARTVVPLHYEGWSHFREGRQEVEGAFAEAQLADGIRWLAPGEPVAVEV